MSEEMKNDIEKTKAEAAEVAEQTAAEGEKTADVVSKKKKGPVIAVIATVAFLVVLVGAILAVLFATGKLGNGGKNKQNMSDKFLTDTDYDTTTLAYEELLQIAEKALNDGDYDKAIENYEKALEANDMSVDAYLGLVEAYIRKGDFEKALEIAKKGYEKTGDQRLQEKIDMLEEGNVVDSRGLTYKRTTYDGDHNIKFWHVFTYDADGRETSITSFDPNGNQTGYVNEVSDDPKIEIRYAYYTETGDVFKIVGELDDVGRTIKQTEYDNDGSVKNYSLYEYEGDKSIETGYSADGEIFHRYISYMEGEKHIGEYYSYDSYSGEFALIYKQVSEGDKTSVYDGAGNLESYSIREYDENGNCIGETEYNPDGTVRTYTTYE